MAGKYTSTDSAQGATFGQDAVDTLRAAKDAIEEGAEKIPGGQRVKEFTQAAADSLSTTADYVRSHDARRMVSDVEAVVRNNPGPALLIAAAVGFMLGRSVVRH